MRGPAPRKAGVGGGATRNWVRRPPGAGDGQPRGDAGRGGLDPAEGSGRGDHEQCAHAHFAHAEPLGPHGCDEPAAEVGAQHRGDHVERIEGVSDVSVEIPNGRLTVHSTPTVTDEAVHAAIGQAGYTIAASA